MSKRWEDLTIKTEKSRGKRVRLISLTLRMPKTMRSEESWSVLCGQAQIVGLPAPFESCTFDLFSEELTNTLKIDTRNCTWSRLWRVCWVGLPGRT